ncbi:MAG: FAD-dependent oxidoreductase [Verrucomicrobia bacterium]|nr:FAD-dependent oxidoreductase [Verrucomicrobiota bacterium]
MLKTTTAALLATTAHLPAAQAVKKKVIVIGGGIGGLSCAYDLMERGHDVTVLEASKRSGGHVKTIYDPLPDGLYADVGAEQFCNPGYEAYRHWVRKFDLPVLEYRRRRDMYRMVRGQWRTEEDLAEAKMQREFGFNEREVAYMQAHGWMEMSRLYFGTMAGKFKDEHQPFGNGLDDLDHITAADWMASVGASEAAREFSGAGRLSTKGQPPTESDVSALYRIWQEAVVQMRGLPVFKREVFRLKGGNQLLPDTFAMHLGARIRKNCPVLSVAHDAHSVAVTFTDGRDAKPQTLKADHVVFAIAPMLLGNTLEVTPELPEAKRFALANTPMSVGSRVLLQAKTRFWESDALPSINLVTGNGHMSLVYECASEVPGESCVLMGTGQVAQTPEETLAAFRKFYPGKNKDTIERCIVHQWWKEEPLAINCERTPFPLGKLVKIWPQLIQPVGRLHFAGAAYDTLPWGQDAATLSARRVAEAISQA